MCPTVLYEIYSLENGQCRAKGGGGNLSERYGAKLSIIVLYLQYFIQGEREGSCQLGEGSRKKNYLLRSCP